MATKPTPTLDEYLDLILEAAQAHGQESEEEHEVGDLQTVIHEMWKLLSDDQKMAVVASDDVRDILETWGTP